MKLSEIPPLGEDLVMIVFGPGVGESILIYWPPNHWLAVDSFSRRKGQHHNHPARDALIQFDAYADAVALTHPHEDHTGGFDALVQRRKPGGFVGWWPTPPAVLKQRTANAGLATRLRPNEHAVAAIMRVWSEEPGAKWELGEAQPPLKIGAASVQSLTPTSAAASHNHNKSQPKYNEMSSAMLFTWQKVVLLLGADLVNTRGWDSLEANHGPEAWVHNRAIKLAHHGSKEAQHPVALGTPPPTDRLHLGTPYARGRKVPDYGENEDVDQILQVANRIYYSAHHGPRSAQASTEDVSRETLESPTLDLGPIAVSLNTAAEPIEDCWVAASWSSGGDLKYVHRGPGSVCVVQ